MAYSREVAFSAAEIYARAAELRGAWDARLEALVVDAVLRGETDEAVLSRASTLGWRSTAEVVVVVGGAPENDAPQALEAVRHTAAIAGLDMLGAVQSDRMVIVLGGPKLSDPALTSQLVGRFVGRFGPGTGSNRTRGRAPDGGGHFDSGGHVGLPRGGGVAGGAATGGRYRPVARTGPVRQRSRPAGAGPRPVRPAGRGRRGAAGHPGHLLGPGPAGRSGRPRPVRAREHGALPPSADPRGHRLLPPPTRGTRTPCGCV